MTDLLDELIHSHTKGKVKNFENWLGLPSAEDLGLDVIREENGKVTFIPNLEKMKEKQKAREKEAKKKRRHAPSKQVVHTVKKETKKKKE